MANWHQHVLWFDVVCAPLTKTVANVAVCTNAFLLHAWFFVCLVFRFCFLFLAVPDPYRFERDLGDD